jgi:hypothetical protein
MRFWVSVSLGLSVSLAAFGQSPSSPQTRPGTHLKVNELTLAGLRPGRDKVAKALQLFGQPDTRSSDKQSLGWSVAGPDGAYYLNLDVDKSDVVQFIRVSRGEGPSGKGPSGEEASGVTLPKHNVSLIRGWASGRGLTAGAKASRVVQIYGQPDSRSPSTKAGRKLELLYYAFDWAGADVPQVMEVSCTVGDDGNPGRVEEITLAAPSL